MAFTLQIKKKSEAPKSGFGSFLGKIIGSSKIDFGTFLGKILVECGLQFGSYDDFYALEEGKVNNQTVVLYNPERIGRGIQLNAENLKNGEVTVAYNIPTTASEIRDFVKVVKAIQEQFGDVSICEADLGDTYTIATLEEEVDHMIAASREKIRSDLVRTEFSAPLLTLAKFLWAPDEETWKRIGTGDTMDDFEETIHKIQTEEIYHVNPQMYRNEAAGDGIVAVFTLAANIKFSIPVDPEVMVVAPGCSLGERYGGISDTVVTFVIAEEDRFIDGLYPYSAFLEYVKARGAEPFDANRIKVPEMSEDEIMAFIKSLEE